MVLKDTSQVEPREILEVFQRLLPTAVVMAFVRAWPARSCWRVYSPLVTLWGFSHQFLSQDHTCDGVIGSLRSGDLDAWEAAESQAYRGFAPSTPLSERVSPQNGPYCQARKRFPLEVLHKCLRITARHLQQEARKHWTWLDRTVLLLDGTTFLTQWTPELKEHYKCHENQNGAGHWPVLRSVASFDMHTGAAVALVEGTLHASEQALAVQLFHMVGEFLFGDPENQHPDELADQELADQELADQPAIYVGDRNFGVFLVAQAAQAAGQDFLLRLTDKRVEAMLKRLLPEVSFNSLDSGTDLNLNWRPSKQDQVLSTMEPRIHFSGPDPDCVPGRLICWRLERPGFRPENLYLFTNLLDSERYPAQSLVELYGYRWKVEMCFRELKSTLELTHLQSKSVDMVRKELCAGLLAYNLIRGVMLQAAVQGNCNPLDLSFKRSWRRIIIMTNNLGPAALASPHLHLSRMLDMISTCTIYHRKKSRSEPRAVWGRPCPYPHKKPPKVHTPAPVS